MILEIDEGENGYSDNNKRICNIESRPVPVFNVPINKIHNIAKADSIHIISKSAP